MQWSKRKGCGRYEIAARDHCSFDGALFDERLPQHGRPIRTAAKSMGLGAASLVLVHLTTSLTGLTLGLNFFTVGCSLLLGLPGVIAMLVLRVLWI